MCEVGLVYYGKRKLGGIAGQGYVGKAGVHG